MSPAQSLQEQLNAERAEEHAMYESQMKLLRQFDQSTKVPHLLIELRSLGYVEICGKNIGGIYEKLDHFFKTEFGASDTELVMRKVPPEGCCSPEGPACVMLPKEPCDDVCDKNYVCGQQRPDGSVHGSSIFKRRGTWGENNMGLLTMKVIGFMTNECGWGLHLTDGGNLGGRNQIRETQIKFRAPHPLNLMAPHLMIELRAVGYIEVNGQDSGGIHRKLTDFLRSKWDAHVDSDRDPDYCALKFSTFAFKQRGGQGENNMGKRTMELVDFMTQECHWTLLACTGGNAGVDGRHREQQLVFRHDEHVQRGEPHLMVELRDQGYVEINGTQAAPEAAALLHDFFKSQGCEEYKSGFWEGEAYCDVKYRTPRDWFYRDGTTNNLGRRTLEVASFLGQRGWMLQLCNGGHTASANSPWNLKREQQIKFRRTQPGEDASAPLLMIELRAVPENAEGHYQGWIEMNGPNTHGVYEKVVRYMEQTMLCQPVGPKPYCDLLLKCGCFRMREANTSWWHQKREGRLIGESNFGRYTMRLCDYMVDHLGEWDLLVCNGNSVTSLCKSGLHNSDMRVNGREQQLVFRHRPGGRKVFMAADVAAAALGRAPCLPPHYWKDSTKDGAEAQQIIAVSDDEKSWIQQVLDGTYKKKVTRDRSGSAMADRFVVVSALRSEHPGLWDQYAQKRSEVARSMKGRRTVAVVEPKTMQACSALKERCQHPRLGNPGNEAYLLHGSNPTSAISILTNSFKVDFAGAAVGTMFGPGIYLAESSSKSDEYARDENTGGAYDGLFAVLLCRVVLGSSYVVEDPGNYADKCTSGEFDSVVGDREKAVGTFREFVVFDAAAVYPEYVAFYRREHGDPATSAGEAPPPSCFAPPQHSMAATVEESDEPRDATSV